VCLLDSSGSEQGTVVRLCEHVNKSSGSTKLWEYLVWLRKCWLLKKDSNHEDGFIHTGVGYFKILPTQDFTGEP
jgi:hypothetical protein